MTEPAAPANAYLRELEEGKQVIARAVRERRTTAPRATVVTPQRWWIALTAALALAACSGGSHPDTYAKGTHVLEACCEKLQGGGRDKCLADVPRVADPGAANTATNQQTYTCIVDHFTCDPATGHATQPSAQAQYDCIEDLQ